jgi:hypothetical protein
MNASVSDILYPVSSVGTPSVYSGKWMYALTALSIVSNSGTCRDNCAERELP